MLQSLVRTGGVVKWRSCRFRHCRFHHISTKALTTLHDCCRTPGAEVDPAAADARCPQGRAVRMMSEFGGRRRPASPAASGQRMRRHAPRSAPTWRRVGMLPPTQRRLVRPDNLVEAAKVREPPAATWCIVHTSSCDIRPWLCSLQSHSTRLAADFEPDRSDSDPDPLIC